MNKKNNEDLEVNFLTSEETQGIIVLVIILCVGWFSILAPVWWVKVVGYVVLGLTALSAWKIGKGIQMRMKEENIENIEKTLELKKKEQSLKDLMNREQLNKGEKLDG